MIFLWLFFLDFSHKYASKRFVALKKRKCDTAYIFINMVKIVKDPKCFWGLAVVKLEPFSIDGPEDHLNWTGRSRSSHSHKLSNDVGSFPFGANLEAFKPFWACPSPLVQHHQQKESKVLLVCCRICLSVSGKLTIYPHYVSSHQGLLCR